MRNTAAVIGVICLICFLAVGCIIWNIVGWGADVATGVVQRQVNPDAIVQNYEYFTNQYHDIQATDGQIEAAKFAINDWYDTNGKDPNKWTFQDREELARLKTNMTGLVQARKDMAAQYNAKSREISRNLWKSKELPYQIDQ